MANSRNASSSNSKFFDQTEWHFKMVHIQPNYRNVKLISVLSVGKVLDRWRPDFHCIKLQNDFRSWRSLEANRFTECDIAWVSLNVQSVIKIYFTMINAHWVRQCLNACPLRCIGECKSMEFRPHFAIKPTRIHTHIATKYVGKTTCQQDPNATKRKIN